MQAQMTLANSREDVVHPIRKRVETCYARNEKPDMLAEAEQTLMHEHQAWKALQAGVPEVEAMQDSFEKPLQPLFKGALEELQRYTESLPAGPRQQLLRKKLQQEKPEVTWGFQFCCLLASLGHGLADTHPTRQDTLVTVAMED